MSRHSRLPLLAAIVLATLVAAPAHAQGGWADRLKKKAEEAAKKKIEKRTEERAGQAADAAMARAECAASDKLCQERKAKEAAAAGGSAAPAAVGATAPASPASAKVGEGAWVNYDFKPGDRPLLADDYAGDEVGDFPRRLEMVGGNMEIAEWNGARFLRGTSEPTQFEVVLRETLPERFTLEFDFKPGGLDGSGKTAHPALSLRFGPKKLDYGEQIVLIEAHGRPGELGMLRAGLYHHNTSENRTEVPMRTGDLFAVRLMADGRYFKMYVNGTRVANVPNTTIERTKSIRFQMRCTPSDPCFVGPIRLMAGGKKLYEALAESGRVATQGVYFDTGSDRVRPESTPTLKEIAQMLTEHPDLSLTIEGHTDNSGDAKANDELSQRRAAAVKDALVTTYKIGEARLTSAGFGARKPVAPNTTPEGRQQNRRVELVKR